MARVNSIRKGKHGERLAAKYLRSLGFEDCIRGQQHAGGPESPDVDGIPGVHLEVKFGVGGMDLGTQLHGDAISQSMREAGDGEAWCVLWKRPRSRQWLLTVGLEGFKTTTVATLSTDEDIRRWLESRMAGVHAAQ